MQMDKTELGCLRAIVLFNPGSIISFFTWTKRILVYSLFKTLLWYSCQMRKDSPAQRRWSCLEKRSMHHWKLIANRSIQSSREGKRAQLWRALITVVTCICWQKNGGKIIIFSAGLLSSSSDCQRYDPLAWSAWSIFFSSNWSVTRQLTRSSWKCSKPPISCLRLEICTVVLERVWSLGSERGTGVALFSSKICQFVSPLSALHFSAAQICSLDQTQGLAWSISWCYKLSYLHK